MERTTPRRLIGLTGPCGSGKTTAANILQSWHWARLSFADPLRELVLELNPAWDGWHVSAGKDQRHFPVPLSPREQMRIIGDWANLVSPGLFIRALLSRLDQAQSISGGVVVDDVRYPREAEAIRLRGGVIVRVERPGVSYRQDHPSEQPMRDALDVGPRYVLRNPGGLEELSHELLDLLDQIDLQAES